MFNLYEIVHASQDGQGVKTLARMYGLSDQQAEAAVGAILPAMSQRLQAKAQDPQGMAELFAAMTNGQGVAAFENPAAAQSGDARQFGRDMLGQMFGDRDASRQLAAHASQTIEVGPDIMQKLMPAIIAIVMGGLTKSMKDQGLGGILEQLGGAFGQPGTQRVPGGNNPGPGLPGGSASNGLPGNGVPGGAGGGLGDILGQILGGASGQPGTQTAPGGNNPGPGLPNGSASNGLPGNGVPGGAGGGLGDILGQILGGALGQPPQTGSSGGGDILDKVGQPSGAPQTGGATPQAPTPGQAGPGQVAFPGGFDPQAIQDMLGKILGHGTQQAPQQQANLNDILGQLFGNKR